MVPTVSVVMGAYNADADIGRAASSILGQAGVEFELIVVNDGSTDETEAILRELAAKDPRVRVIEKAANEGLTLALIEGCKVARGELIARQDSDDVSLPGRLAAQSAFMKDHPEAVMTACGTRFVGPKGEPLFDAVRDGIELHEGLQRTPADKLQGSTCHGAVMFRREAYEKAGGYRPEFRIAQDVDLWVRMSELDYCLGMPEVLYEAAWRPGSISHIYRDLQLRALETIVESRELRRRGESDAALLQGFESAVMEARERNRGRRVSGCEQAGFSYFLGSTLSGRDDAGASAYFRDAVRQCPLHWRAWVKLGISAYRSTRGAAG